MNTAVTPFARSAALRWLAAGLAVAALAGCDRFEGGSTAAPPRGGLPADSALDAVALGDVAGAAPNVAAESIENPYAGDPQAREQGRHLYVKMNCAGCHGYKGKGGMGPDLTDPYWRYGAVPASIYKSIAEGRPQGMPAWGRALPPQEIWKLVAYVESFGGSVPARAEQAALQGDAPGERVAPEERPAPAASDASAGDRLAPPGPIGAASAASASRALDRPPQQRGHIGAGAANP